MAGALEGIRGLAHKGPGYEAADPERLGQRKGDTADDVEPVEPGMGCGGGDLEYAVRRGIADGVAGTDMLLAQFGDDLGARGVFVSQNARQTGAAQELGDKIQREGWLHLREITPIERHRDACNFPVTGGRVLSLGNFASNAEATTLGCGGQIGRQRTGRQRDCSTQAHGIHIRKAEWAGPQAGTVSSAFSGPLRDMPHRIGAFVTIGSGIGRAPDTDTIEQADNGAGHGVTPVRPSSCCSSSSSGGSEWWPVDDCIHGAIRAAISGLSGTSLPKL